LQAGRAGAAFEMKNQRGLFEDEKLISMKYLSDGRPVTKIRKS